MISKEWRGELEEWVKKSIEDSVRKTIAINERIDAHKEEKEDQANDNQAKH